MANNKEKTKMPTLRQCNRDRGRHWFSLVRAAGHGTGHLRGRGHHQQAVQRHRPVRAPGHWEEMAGEMSRGPL
jgi:hypothetical protein